MTKLFTKISLLFIGLMLCAGNAWAATMIGTPTKVGDDYLCFWNADGITCQAKYIKQPRTNPAVPMDFYNIDNSTVSITGYNGSANPIVIPENVNIGKALMSMNGATPSTSTTGDVLVYSIASDAFTDEDDYDGKNIQLPSPTHDAPTLADTWSNTFYEGLTVVFPESEDAKMKYYIAGWPENEIWTGTQQGTWEGTTINWSYDNNGTLTLSGSGAMPAGSVEIEAIPWKSFKKRIKHVIFSGNAITTICHNAFYDCLRLQDIAIPNAVTSIGETAFKNDSSLTAVIIDGENSNLETIEAEAFSKCSALTSIIIPAKVTSIKALAFIACYNVTSITAYGSTPAALSHISSQGSFNTFTGQIVFLGSNPGNASSTQSMTATVTVPSGKECKYKNAWGEITTNNESQTVCTLTFANAPAECPDEPEDFATGSCGTNLTWTYTDHVLTISGTGTSMTNFEYEAAPWQSLKSSITSVVMDAANVTNIGNYAFYNYTNLTSITLGAAVTTIGTNAIEGCTAISEPIYNNHIYVKMPNSWLATHGGDVVISEGTTDIYSGAFRDCANLTSVSIPNSVTSINSSAFRNCTALISVAIPSGVTAIQAHTFRGCTSLTTVTLGANVTSLGNYAFDGCPLTSPIISGSRFFFMPTNYSGAYTIPDYINTISNNAFNGCTGLTSVIIPDAVTTIGSTTFQGCTSLTSVIIPDAVTTIQANAFNGCTSLATVTLGDAVATIGTDAFKNCPLTSPLCNSTRFFLMLPANYSGAYTIPNGITTISNNAFKNCQNLTSVIIPNSVTSIGTGVFQGCSNMTSVTLPSGMGSTIPADMFNGCYSLVEFHFKGKAPIAVGNYSVFNGVPDPTTFYVPKGTRGAYVTTAELGFWEYEIIEENIYGDATAVNENYSWLDEYWTEHNANYATAAYNALVASANAHEFAENFTIVRPIQANGYLNTICLPFDLSEAQIANSDLAEAEIFAFDAQNTGAEIEIVLDEVTEMEAGMPYFFRYPNGTAETPNLSELNFHDVTISTATATPKTVDAGTFRLKGTLQNTLLNSATNYLFLGAEDALFYPDFGGAGVTNDDLTLRPFRAYFEATGGANLAPARITFGHKTTTDIEDVQSDKVQSIKVLENGQLFIIKNGVKYNVQGQVVK